MTPIPSHFGGWGLPFEGLMYLDLGHVHDLDQRTLRSILKRCSHLEILLRGGMDDDFVYNNGRDLLLPKLRTLTMKNIHDPGSIALLHNSLILPSLEVLEVQFPSSNSDLSPVSEMIRASQRPLLGLRLSSS